MKRGKRSWADFKRFVSSIHNITEDWLTPVEYLPYIYAVLGDIDLDPCSTHKANAEFLKARKIYTLEEDGLNIDDPWTGKTYLFPPTYGRCSYSQVRGTWRWGKRAGANSMAPSIAWFKRLVREWKLRNIPEAIFFTTYPEMMRLHPEMWDYPVCIPEKRANLMHGKNFYRFKAPMHWGYFIYLPKLEYGFTQTKNFVDVFSNIGNVILNQ